MYDLDVVERFAISPRLCWGRVLHPDILCFGKEFVVLQAGRAPLRLPELAVALACPLVQRGARVFFADAEAIHVLEIDDFALRRLAENSDFEVLPSDHRVAGRCSARFTSVLSVDARGSQIVSVLACGPGGYKLVFLDLARQSRWYRSLAPAYWGVVAADATLRLVFFPPVAGQPVLESLDGKRLQTFACPPYSSGDVPMWPRSAIRSDGGAVLVCLPDVGVALHERGGHGWIHVDALGQAACFAVHGQSVFYVGSERSLCQWEGVTTGAHRLITPVKPTQGPAVAPVQSRCGRYLLVGFGNGDGGEFLVIDLRRGLVDAIGWLDAIAAVWLPTPKPGTLRTRAAVAADA